MLFVFGYRAQKIRSKKLSVLIHSSDKHKDVESCTVEVHFQKIIDKVYICIYISAFVTQTQYTTNSLYQISQCVLCTEEGGWTILKWTDIFLVFIYFFPFITYEMILLHSYYTKNKTQTKISHEIYK